MTLNNKNLILLNKFTIAAKKQLGPVKVSLMINDERYAFKTLTSAAMSNDKDLIDISKELSNQLQIGTDVVSAIEAFVQSSTSLFNDEEGLHECKYFLVKLTSQLYGVSINGETYRCAVDEMLLNVDVKDKKKYIDLARRFYRYWNAWGNSTNKNSIEINQKLMAQKEKFIELWANIDNELFTESESWPLSLYVESIHQKGLQKEEKIVCQRIAKVVTIELRKEQEIKQNSYREVVERVHLLFERDDLRKLFLHVSRDFHHFWLNTYTANSLEA